MEKLIFNVEYDLSASVDTISDPYSGQIGMDAWGNYYQYWTIGFDSPGWKEMYHWDLASNGISCGWTEEQDNGDAKNYLLFRNGYFYLTADWNNAEYYGWKWQPRQFAEFKRMYHLLFKEHFKPGDKVSYPGFEERQNDFNNKV